jgi:hypothetical protein
MLTREKLESFTLYLSQARSGELKLSQRELDEVERLVMESSLHEFLEQAWPIVEPDTPFIDGWHIRAVCEHLEAVVRGEIRNLLINVPPGSCKSHSCCVALCPWVWTTNPGFRFFYASYDQGLSTRDSLRSRTIIDSEWYRELWGERVLLRSDQNEKMRFENSKKGWRIASSVGGRILGEHPDIILADDPNNAKSIKPEAAELQSVKDWWRNQISSRGRIRGVRRVIIMQRLHQDDLSQYVLDQAEGDWEHLCLPMRFENNRMKTTVLGFNDPRTYEGELLWDPPFTEQVVSSMEREMGSLTAAGQLQQSLLVRDSRKRCINTGPRVDSLLGPRRK